MMHTNAVSDKRRKDLSWKPLLTSYWYCTLCAFTPQWWSCFSHMYCIYPLTLFPPFPPVSLGCCKASLIWVGLKSRQYFYQSSWLYHCAIIYTHTHTYSDTNGIYIVWCNSPDRSHEKKRDGLDRSSGDSPAALCLTPPFSRPAGTSECTDLLVVSR